MSSSRRISVLMLLAMLGSTLGIGACNPSPVSCSAPQRDYKGTCVDGAVANFAACTATHGSDLTTEEKQKFGATVDVGIKSVGGVVELSKKIVATENSEVALEIVKNCLELSKSAAAPAEQIQIQTQLQTLQQMLDATSQGTISLNPTSGPYSQEIVVTGTGWPANIEVEVVASTAKKRTFTTADGSFRTTIRLDPTFEKVAISPVTFRVGPVKSSILRDATALYEIVK